MATREGHPVKASLGLFILGGVVALLVDEPRIAASTSAVAYVLLLLAWPKVG